MSAPHSTDAGGLDLRTILAAIYRHRVAVILLGLAGLGAAAYLYSRTPPVFESKAKLLVRYVIERRSLDGGAENAETLEPASEEIVETEQEILTSYDLAQNVAEAMGPRRFLNPSTGESADRSDEALQKAAGTVANGLVIDSSNNVLQLAFRNPDKEIAKSALDTVMEEYFKKHIEIRREVKSVDFLIEEEAKYRQRLAETNAEINRLRSESGVMSLDALTEGHRLTKQGLQDELQEVRVDLRIQEARVARADREQEAEPDGEEAAAPDDGDLAAERKKLMIAANRLELLNGRTAYLENSRNELLAKYPAGHQLVRKVENQIDATREDIAALADEHPSLLAGDAGDPALLNPSGGREVLEELRKREAVLTEQLDETNHRFEEEYQIGVRLAELERQRESNETKHELLQTSLERTRGDEALDPSLIPNISILQNPSPPVRILDEDLLPILLGLAGGGFALGIGFALVRDLVFDSRVRGRAEIETRLQLPLLLSIPYFKTLARNSRRHLRADASAGQNPHRLSLNVTGPSTPITPYAEAVRDRLLLNFHLNNVTHKPKLVALAGLSDGVGTSTLARELAAALTKTPGTRTLLVDMNARFGAVADKQSNGAIRTVSLDTAISLAKESKIHPGELYVASVASQSDGGRLNGFAPKHLFDLLPHLHASTFDYILFDMPPVNATSPTPAMAGMLDKTLLVLDAEDTDRESLRQGYSELVRGGADVSCIFNRTREQPRWLARAS